MKLILTSFGLSHLTRKSEEDKNLFYRMPPVSMSQFNQSFLPDYSTLLLADKIIIDSQTYDKLISGYHHTFGNVSDMIRSLCDEGFVQIEDFEEVIQDNKVMLQDILKRDLKELDLWVEPLNESINSWSEFVNRFDDNLRNEVFDQGDYQRNLHSHSHDIRAYHRHSIRAALHHTINQVQHMGMLSEALKSSTKRRKSEYRNILKEQLSEYLSYVNANLLLSQRYKAGFHDWQDFSPFYREKFLRIAKDSSPAEKEINNVKKLFEISFPEFSYWQPKNVIKALKDKRIKDLRELIDLASKGDIEFDKEFANRVLSEVVQIESSITKFRTIVSYATTPLGFIPIAGTPLQKITEEAIVQPVQKKKRQKFRWFYMISELAKKMK